MRGKGEIWLERCFARGLESCWVKKSERVGVGNLMRIWGLKRLSTGLEFTTVRPMKVEIY